MWARVCLIVACAFYVAGESPLHVPLHVGEQLRTSIATFSIQDFRCYLETPAKDKIPIKPENEVDPSKYEVLAPNSMIGCAVNVNITGAEDNGLWRLFFETKDGDVQDESYLVTVDGADNGESALHVPLHVGEQLRTSIVTFSIQDFRCYLETPAKDKIPIQPENEVDPSKYEVLAPNSMIGCAVNVNITGAEDNGLWRLFFETKDGDVRDESYLVTVDGADNDQSSSEDTENIKIEYLEKQIIHTQIGAAHKITIKKYDFVETKSCVIVTPDSVKYESHDRDIPGIEWIEDENVDCGVEIMVEGKEMVGIWTLYSRAVRHSESIEKRLPFAIHVEEYVKSTPQEVTIAVGNELHVRLVEPTPLELRQTCRITGPNQEDVSSYIIDTNHIDTCGFIITGVQAKDNGTWHIVYGTSIVYKAPVEVTVTGDMELTNENLKWITNEPIDDVVVGPDDAVYCRVRDPAFRVVSERFGRCQITLDRATKNHNGKWTLTVGVSGRITTDDYSINVVVLDAEPRPKVLTHVAKQQPDVILGCSLPGDREVQTCQFRDPAGRILLATEGVREDRYSSHGDNFSCGLRISSPTTQDLGLWRCAIETADGDVHYGFLRVLSPLALQDEDVAASVITEPVLKPYESSVWGAEGVMTLSCSIQSQIKYCYFRANNGTIYNIDSGMSNDGLQYVGDGFEAGDCGVRMNLQAGDTGTWSCHVGLGESYAEEQRSTISVYVNPIFSASQISHGSSLTLNGRMFEGRALDYCRYVRIDGLGFTEENAPPQYVVFSDLHHGECALYIPHGTILDQHPWTIAARVRGQTVELVATTQPTLVIPPGPPGGGSSHNFSAARFWTLVILLIVTISFIALILTTKKSRNWTSKKAAALRNSFRRNRTTANNTSTNNASPPAYTA